MLAFARHPLAIMIDGTFRTNDMHLIMLILVFMDAVGKTIAAMFGYVKCEDVRRASFTVSAFRMFYGNLLAHIKCCLSDGADAFIAAWRLASEAMYIGYKQMVVQRLCFWCVKNPCQLRKLFQFNNMTHDVSNSTINCLDVPPQPPPLQRYTLTHVRTVGLFCRHLVIQKLQEETATYGSTDAHKSVEFGLIHLLMNIRNFADYPSEVNEGFTKCVAFVDKKLANNVISNDHAAALIRRLKLFRGHGALLFPGYSKCQCTNHWRTTLCLAI